MRPRSVLLLRHAEALKNIEDRHGGAGTGLTNNGLQDCVRIAAFLREVTQGTTPCLFGHRVPQVQMTVNSLAGALDLSPIWDERLHGIDLGLLAGLSRDEASQRYPDSARRLDLWREGRLRIDELAL